jgi:hypothetical protein
MAASDDQPSHRHGRSGERRRGGGRLCLRERSRARGVARLEMKRALQIEELAALKADIDKGLADLAAGRVKKFDAKAIVARGRKLLAAGSASA